MSEVPCGVFVSGYQLFRAIKLDEDGDDQALATKFGYKLVGPGNAEYYLMRVNGHPHLLIAMDLKRRIQAPPFKAVVFSDEGTELRIARQG